MAKNIAKTGSYTDFTSLSKLLEIIPVRSNVCGDLGFFGKEFLNTDTVVIPRTTIADYSMVDVPWGTRVKNTQKDSKAALTLRVPHFGAEDAILPLDIRGKFAWDDLVANERPQTVQAYVAQKMKAAKQNMVNTWSKAMIQLINDGTAYAPNGTVVTNYYTEFGVTRSELDIDLTDETVDPKPAVKAIIRDIQSNFKGGFTPSRFVGLCDSGFFDKLERHPYVVDAVKYFEQSQSVEILMGKLGTQGMNLDARYEVLEFGGVTWICVAEGEIEENTARVFPTDVPDMFKIFFAPSAENFDLVNSTALEAYYFEYMDAERKDKVEIVYETNPLTCLLWPKALVKVTITA